MNPTNPNESAAERVEALRLRKWFEANGVVQIEMTRPVEQDDNARLHAAIHAFTLTLEGAPDAERAELLARVAKHERTITRMHRQAATSRRFWIRDAEEALAGNPQSLRNRIEMAKSDPVDVVLSDAALAKATPQTHPLDQERGKL
jgi:hypothetical protein